MEQKPEPRISLYPINVVYVTRKEFEELDRSLRISLLLNGKLSFVEEIVARLLNDNRARYAEHLCSEVT